MGDRKEVRVFISSPGDCDAEREAVMRVIEEMNQTVGLREGLFFQAVRWEDIPPGLGENPQAVIDESLGNYNVLVGIMWMRFGTPIPGGAGSGTEHEVRQATESWRRVGEPRVMFYFKQDSPKDLSMIDPVQLQKVQEFRNRLQTAALVQTFHGTSDFESKFRVHLNNLVGHLRPSARSARVITMPHRLFSPPPTRGFKGRSNELERLGTFLDNENISMVVIEGISGIGKTALSAHFASTIKKQDYRSFWLDCREDTSLDSIASALAAFARDNNDELLADLLEDVTLSLEDRLLRIAAEIADFRYALFFDDYHTVADPLVNRLIQKIGERALRAKLFMICRHRPRIAASTNPLLLVEHTIRAGLDPLSCSQFLTECGLDISEKAVRQIWKLTGEGHPKALEIFAARSRTYPVTELLSSLPVFREELKNEWLTPLLNELPKEEREVAIDLSLFDRPIPQQAVISLYPEKGLDPLIIKLVDRFILDRMAENTLRMHPLIRDFCYTLIPDKRSKHVWAGEYYLELSGSEHNPELISDSQIEAGIAAWSHLIKAEEHVRAAEVLNRLRAPLMNRGQYEQVMFLIEQTPKSVENEDWYAIHKARILSLWGDFDGAVSTISPLVDSGVEGIAREAVLVLATIFNDHNRPDEARKLLEARREHVLRNAPPLAYRRFLYRLVETYSLLGDLDQALSWASKIAQTCEAEGDEISGAISLRQMATVLLHQKKLDMALSLAQISHSMLIKHQRLRDAAITQVLTASIHRALMNWESASRCLEDSLQAFLTMGDRKNSTICRQQIRDLKAMSQVHPSQ